MSLNTFNAVMTTITKLINNASANNPKWLINPNMFTTFQQAVFTAATVAAPTQQEPQTCALSVISRTSYASAATYSATASAQTPWTHLFAIRPTLPASNLFRQTIYLAKMHISSHDFSTPSFFATFSSTPDKPIPFAMLGGWVGGQKPWQFLPVLNCICLMIKVLLLPTTA